MFLHHSFFASAIYPDYKKIQFRKLQNIVSKDINKTVLTAVCSITATYDSPGRMCANIFVSCIYITAALFLISSVYKYQFINTINLRTLFRFKHFRVIL